jgi:hypothetical protein
MPKKVKVNLGWRNGGWIGSFVFSTETVNELKIEIPSVPIEALERIVAEYVLYRDKEHSKPTLAERKANLRELTRSLKRVIELLGMKGIDQISQHHINAKLALMRSPQLISDFRKLFELLDNVVILEAEKLETEKKGRPRKLTEQDFARQIVWLLEEHQVKVTTTKNGPFVRTLEILLEEAGDKKEDGQSLARLVLKKSNRKE